MAHERLAQPNQKFHPSQPIPSRAPCCRGPRESPCSTSRLHLGPKPAHGSQPSLLALTGFLILSLTRGNKPILGDKSNPKDSQGQCDEPRGWARALFDIPILVVQSSASALRKANHRKSIAIATSKIVWIVDGGDCTSGERTTQQNIASHPEKTVGHLEAGITRVPQPGFGASAAEPSNINSHTQIPQFLRQFSAHSSTLHWSGYLSHAHIKRLLNSVFNEHVSQSKTAIFWKSPLRPAWFLLESPNLSMFPCSP